ncbi:MAG: ABC transporter permease [Candidatus Omnitrophica bacterium]|nr:ABC transporter permease [Candidatus Omnitrophota bacterium]
MINYFLKRTLGLVPLFLGITFISFVVIRLAPGGPEDAYSQMNPKMTRQAGEKLRALYGLDKPILTQYGNWLRRVLRLDFGTSFKDGESAFGKIARAMPITLFLNLLTLLIILALGVPLGVYGAVREGSFGDRLWSVLAFAGFSLPTFWVALLLISLLGVQWHILPVSGLTSLFFDEMSFLEKVWDLSRHLILPVFLSALTGLAGISRYVRSHMIRILKENYIRTARAKGLPERVVIWRHAMRNAALPLVTLLGLSIPGLLGGSVIFESIFSIPGMGRLFYNSVFARDYPVIMGILVFGALLTMMGNLLADLAYAVVDPRVRLGARSR